MAVIINDLEVVVRPPEGRPADKTAEGSTTEQRQSTQLFTPRDLTVVLEQQIDRSCRVRAH